MKKYLLPILLCSVHFFFSYSASAQDTAAGNTPPSWTSDKGYWVVVSNRHTPKEATVYYYSNDHVLVYKEEIKNKKLKLTHTATLMRLKQSLEVALASYENGNRATKDQGLTLQQP